MKMQELIGMKIKSTVAADTANHKADRDHVIESVWVSQETGDYVAWSANGKSGEHLRAGTEEALVRRVMSLK